MRSRAVPSTVLRSAPVLLMLLGTLLVAPVLAVEVETPTPSTGLDYDPENRGWNGTLLLKELTLNHSRGFERSLTLDLGALDPEVILVILYPNKVIDPESLVRYVKMGGRVLLANDFGRGLKEIPFLNITFGGEVLDDSNNFGRNAFAPVVTPDPLSPLSIGVNRIVTNHPAFLLTEGGDAHFSPGARTLSGETPTDGGLVFAISKKIGSGRIVVLSDPSILINEMLPRGDNAKFYLNSLAWLSKEEIGYRVKFVAISWKDPLSELSNQLISPWSVLLAVLGVYSLAAVGVLLLGSPFPRLEIFRERKTRGWLESQRERIKKGEYFPAAEALARDAYLGICRRLGLSPSTDEKGLIIGLLSAAAPKGYLERRRMRRFAKRIHQLNNFPEASRYIHVSRGEFERLDEMDRIIRSRLLGPGEEEWGLVWRGR